MNKAMDVGPAAAGAGGAGGASNAEFSSRLADLKFVVNQIVKYPKAVATPEAQTKLREKFKNALSWYTAPSAWDNPNRFELITKESVTLARQVFEAWTKMSFDLSANVINPAESNNALDNVVYQGVRELAEVIKEDLAEDVDDKLHLKDLQKFIIKYRLPKVQISLRRLPARSGVELTPLRTGSFQRIHRCVSINDVKASFARIKFQFLEKQYESQDLPYTVKSFDDQLAYDMMMNSFPSSYTYDYTASNRELEKNYRGLWIDATFADHAICPMMFLNPQTQPVIVIVNAWHLPSPDAFRKAFHTKYYKTFVFPNDAVSKEDPDFRNLQDADAGKGQCQDWSLILAFKFAQAFSYNDLLPRGVKDDGEPNYDSLYAKVRLFYKTLYETRDLTAFQREVGLLGGGGATCVVQ